MSETDLIRRSFHWLILAQLLRRKPITDGVDSWKSGQYQDRTNCYDWNAAPRDANRRKGDTLQGNYSQHLPSIARIPVVA
jgi:hypothetical protein